VVYRILAERLARGGFHVLRFDNFGTGDSTGDDAAGTLEQWVSDILRADDEVVRRSGSPRSVWLGLRLGATLAALASSRATRKPRRLVLWDPIVDGSAYLKALTQAHMTALGVGYDLRWESEGRLRSRAAAQAESEALGYPLPPRLKAELGALALPSFHAVSAEQVTLVSASAGGEAERLQQYLSSAGIAVQNRAIESNITWTVNDMLHGSVLPAQDIRTLLLALTEDP
jgi:pimeloyl-ACP methyl ester carboxylesterase